MNTVKKRLITAKIPAHAGIVFNKDEQQVRVYNYCCIRPEQVIQNVHIQLDLWATGALVLTQCIRNEN